MKELNVNFAEFIKDTAIQMNRVAALAFRPRCVECGDEITGVSYNGRCGPCNQQINREAATFNQKQWEDMNRE